MSLPGYTVEVTNLSPNASEKNVEDFFAFSGTVEHVEITRCGDYACTAYVTFKEPYALNTAVLLNGATIVDQPVCIARWGHYDDAFDLWDQPWMVDNDSAYMASHESHLVSTPGEALTIAQDVVKAMVSKGYVLGKDALIKAKAFDESHHVTASAMAKAAELSRRIGLTDKIETGVGAIRSVDERYRVSDTTKSVIEVTGKTAAAATTAILNSSYFSAGALWVSGALSKAAKAAADLAVHGANK
ncbi:hypothetical protein AMTRI_Chr04g252690 [Amborella trichopoda]|uniref:RRM domain-containing protein n=1 Tax=Amborella trichopoda TaxID=13333 RepID=W1NFZ8_AMBTC|nr:binding partner of ACD11 1 [Amborella trichopoda]XP_011621985.1 binding partner of ACD11 1 [Amborella trichopoda]ERM94403.1 hypothetical protein AMTR_s00010p00254110 [Amborella trichopoda]|eukprot:XP_011621979.1 binding partner of ACD11 1 [Amborella trichopoda]